MLSIRKCLVFGISRSVLFWCAGMRRLPQPPALSQVWDPFLALGGAMTVLCLSNDAQSAACYSGTGKVVCTRTLHSVSVQLARRRQQDAGIMLGPLHI